MIWETLHGHQPQVEMLRRAIGRGRMTHAFLFCGPDGIGKKRFARLFAQCLLCSEIPDETLDACGECSSCRQMLAGVHSDFLFVECPEGKNVFPIDLIAGSREHRGREGLCYDLSLRPGVGNRRIAVLDDVDLMNDASANALLKTLEEPPDYATLILLSSDRESLLPTIQSRCQAVRFSPLSNDDVAAILVEQSLAESREEANELASVSQGSLSIAGQLADSAMRELRSVVHRALTAGHFPSTPVAANVMATLDTLGDTNAQRRGAVWVFRFCIEAFRNTMRRLSDASQAATDNEDALELTATLIERADAAIRQIERAAPVSLCVHGLFDDLSRMSKPIKTR